MSINILNRRSLALINIIFSVVLILGIGVSAAVYFKGESFAEKIVALISILITVVVARALKVYLFSTVNNKRLSLFITRNPNPIIILDHLNNVTYANPASESLLKRLGLQEDKAELLLAQGLPAYQNKILSDETLHSAGFEYQISHLHFECELHWLEDQRQWDMYLIDVTERKIVEKELLYRATHDPLSGLHNSYELEKTVVELCLKKQEFTFGLIEIRSFSQLISGQGLAVASKVVKELAASIQHIIYTLDKTGCTVFHVGEKSFAIISTNDLNRGQIYALVKKIEEKIASLIFHSKYQVRLDFGFAYFPEHGNDYTILYRNALAALDKSASSEDKNHMFFNPKLGEKLRHEQELIEDMRIAIELQEFELYFQPQLALITGKVVGAEVLIRWQRNGQWISPSEFIPLAESAGLIESLGDWILLTACEKAKYFIDLGLDDLVIAINISPIQFGHKDFLSKVKKVLQKTNLPAQNLELEITEGVIIYNEQQTIETLERLKQLGVQLAIDDFGTGYSSLSYLKKFNIDKLKIDQSFVHHIHSEIADQSIVRTIIELGRNLGLKLIAEGVEELQQQNMLQTMGCDEIQGYYFSRPLPEQVFIEFVQQHRATA
jgi:EAL domain-containing protein (putative c-di-GMP-specific phosphodiesterase class I)/GGDEF domain-containing protein